MKTPIKEPLDVDLEVVSRELNATEAASLRAFLKAHRTKASRQRGRTPRVKASRRKTKA